MPSTIREVMTPDPATFAPNDSVLVAAQAMRDGDFGTAVIAEGESIQGIVTDRDIVVKMVADEGDAAATPLEAVCTPQPLTISPDDSLAAAVDALRSEKVRRLPVVEDSRIVGIVSIGDLAEATQEESALADISAAAPNN